MSSDEVKSVCSLAGELSEALDAIEPYGDGPLLSETVVQSLVAASIKAYVALVNYRADPNCVPAPINEGSGITPTDIMIFANELLKANDVNVFELEMFRVMGTY